MRYHFQIKLNTNEDDDVLGRGPLEDGAGHGTAAPGPPRLLPVEVVLTGGLGEALPRHQVHHGGLACGQPQCGERHVPVEKPALVNQAENLSFGNLKQQTLYTCRERK